MRRYSEAIKADVRRRMSPPNPQSMARISEETGIHVATLYLWRKGWRLEGEVVPASQKDPVNRHRKLHHFRHRKVSHPRPGLGRCFRTGSALAAPAVPLFVHGLCGWLRWLSSVIDTGGTSPAVTPQASSAGIGGGTSPIPAEEEPPACGRNSPDRRFSLSR